MVAFFFFKAEEGIRDMGVTGVQTCALPFCPCRWTNAPVVEREAAAEPVRGNHQVRRQGRPVDGGGERLIGPEVVLGRAEGRSEERRVGKGVDLGGRRIIKKKKKESKNMGGE